MHGCFEVLHPGHLTYLREARALGDRLVVSVICDRYANKGVGRPIFNELERIEMLTHFDFINNVMLCDAENSVGIIKSLRPSIYAKGPEYWCGDDTGNFQLERDAVDGYGGRVVILHGDVVYSSTEILSGELWRKRKEAA